MDLTGCETQLLYCDAQLGRQLKLTRLIPEQDFIENDFITRLDVVLDAGHPIIR